MSLYSQLAAAIRCDPAGRGLTTHATLGRFGGAAELELAATALIAERGPVALVTGFPVLVGANAVAETDGPPGALALATVLVGLGREVHFLCDSFCRTAIEAMCDVGGLPRSAIIDVPTASVDGDRATCLAEFDAWAREYLAGAHGPAPGHLIAIERPGPTHTVASLAAQLRDSALTLARFEAAVPPELRDCSLNMRGEPLDEYVAPLHRLFELAREPSATTAAKNTTRRGTIGIGDGGNEIGLGRVPWELLDAALAARGGGRVASRTATDHLVLAGTSNWGAHALTAAICHAAGRPELFAACDAAREQRALEALVGKAGAVDGLTRRSEPTVDGLPPEVYLHVLAEIRRILTSGT